MFDPEVILVPLGITMILLGVGGMVAIIKWANWMFDPRRLLLAPRTRGMQLALAPEDRSKALETYRQLASEKLDIIKTAITMGYSDSETEKLDKRLEALIGADALKSIIRGEAPLPSCGLEPRGVEAELRALRTTVEA